MQAAKSNKPPERIIPPEVLRRWQDMVRRAVAQNQPVGPMVQQFAEQAFNRRVAHLEAHAFRHRELTGLRKTIAQELERAEETLATVVNNKSDVLPKPYQGYTFELKPKGEKLTGKQQRLKNSPIARASEEHAHKSTAIESMFSNRNQVVRYAESLKAQLQTIDTEQQSLDASLHKGMENRDSLVDELTQMAWALYKVAEEIISSMQPARVAEFLPENTMTAFRLKNAPAILQEEATLTVADTKAAPGSTGKAVAAQVTQAINAGKDDVNALQTAVIELVGDAVARLIESGVAPLGPAREKSAAAARQLGRALAVASTGFVHVASQGRLVAVAIWREVLRRIVKVLAKPHMP